MVADHIAVVNTFSTVGCRLRRAKGFYSGIVRSAFNNKGANIIQSAVHVKSHQADGGHLPAGLSRQEELNVLGNIAVDELATDTMDMHPKYDDKRLDRSYRSFHLAKQVCHLAALALPLWPKVEESGKLSLRPEVQQARKAKGSLPAPPVAKPHLTPADGGHFWVEHGAGFRCVFCPARTTAQRKQHDSTTSCSKDLGKLGQVLAHAPTTGHNLYWVVHQRLGIRVLVCSKCDAYATMEPKGLLEPCAPKGRKPNWDRLRQGKYPTNKFANKRLFCLPAKAV